jgi:hypothetical protein
MKRLALGLLVAVSLALPSPSHAADALRVGSAVLELGWTLPEIQAALPDDLELVLVRDRLPGASRVTAIPTPNGVLYRWESELGGEPVTMNYLEEHGEKAQIVAAGGEGPPLAHLTFENGRLSRATRLVGDYDGASAESLAGALVSALAILLDPAADPPVIVAEDLGEEGGRLRRLEIRTGERQLVLTLGPGRRALSLVENLGRGDVESVRVGWSTPASVPPPAQ